MDLRTSRLPTRVEHDVYRPLLNRLLRDVQPRFVGLDRQRGHAADEEAMGAIRSTGRNVMWLSIIVVVRVA